MNEIYNNDENSNPEWRCIFFNPDCIQKSGACLNFKPQYLQNYSSPTNDLYSVRKRSIGAFKSIFKLLGWGPASLHWLRTFHENFARVVSLAAVQLVSKFARAPLT